MKVHELKIWPPYFDAVMSDRKTCELRKNDRGFHVGDTLLLREWDPKVQGYTGAQQLVVITHITQEVYGLMEGYCVLSIRRIIR